jgi:hypothetical protein
MDTADGQGVGVAQPAGPATSRWFRPWPKRPGGVAQRRSKKHEQDRATRVVQQESLCYVGLANCSLPAAFPSAVHGVAAQVERRSALGPVAQAGGEGVRRGQLRPRASAGAGKRSSGKPCDRAHLKQQKMRGSLGARLLRKRGDSRCQGRQPTPEATAGPAAHAGGHRFQRIRSKYMCPAGSTCGLFGWAGIIVLDQPGGSTYIERGSFRMRSAPLGPAADACRKRRRPCARDPVVTTEGGRQVTSGVQGGLATWLGITPLNVRLGCMMQLPLRKRSEKMPGMSMQSWCHVLHVPFKGQRKVALQAKLAAALHAGATVPVAEGVPAAAAGAPKAASTVAILVSPQQGDGSRRQDSLP